MPLLSKSFRCLPVCVQPWRAKSTALLLAVVALANPAGAAACNALPGVEKILEKQSVKYLLVGDVHGSNEAPMLFFDLICHASAQGRKVAVALEWPTEVDTALQLYLHADARRAQARAALVQALEPIMIGGLGSRAMFKLVDNLKSLIEGGAQVSVRPFQAFGVADAAEYEQQMAANILAAGHDHDLVLVLVGNVHALKTEVMSPVPSHGAYLPMAAYLPAARTITMDTATRVGQAWSCNAPVINAKNCRVWPLMPGKPLPRGVWWGFKKPGMFDASYSVGVPFSASLPEVPPAKGAP